ncbi:MAG: cobyrinate a,c-diamide synthase, partial [Nitrospiraceae bacterium]
DGSSPTTAVGSTAELAKQLDAPVLLVIDGSAMARSAAAMASGYAQFDPNLRVVGVLFNRISSEEHYRLLEEAVEQETSLEVVGYLQPDPSFTVPDRHLGLRTALEQGTMDLYDRLTRAAMQTVDLDKIEALAQSTGPLNPYPGPSPQGVMDREKGKVRVGVAYDPAFCFYYADNLDLLEAEGAELIKFSPMHDMHLPAVDLLYLGGGYPELYGEVLANNVTIRKAVREFAAQGGIIYAECGGLMYLTQGIRDFEGRCHEMVGIFPAEAVMRKPGLTLGYREVEMTRRSVLGEAGMRARGHEFHYSVLVSKGPLEYACSMTDAQGRARAQDGLIAGNTIALYTHLHFASQPHFAKSLISSARKNCSRPAAVRAKAR